MGADAPIGDLKEVFNGKKKMTFSKNANNLRLFHVDVPAADMNKIHE